MFWNSMATNSNMDSILEQPDVSLQTVLEQYEVLQECKAGNRKLLDFLQRVDSLQGMLELITREPLEVVPMAKQYQFPNIACEVLCSDNSFCERITEERSFLSLLFNFFKDSSVPMNPLLASFVSRVLSHIVIRDSQNWYVYQKNGTHLVNYLNDSTDDIIGWFLNHIGTSAVGDLLHNMIMKLEDTRKSLLDWLDKGNFVQRLMEQLGREDPYVHEGVSRLVSKLLLDYQTALQIDNKPENDAIYDALNLPSTVDCVFNVIFGNEEIRESSIINGLNVVVALLGIATPQVPPKQASWVPVDVSNKDVVLNQEVVSLICSRFVDLQKVLAKEPREQLTLTSGVVANRLGKVRLSLLRFYAQILSCRRGVLVDKLVEVGTLKYITNMFWSNQHNSFLHRLVESILTNVILTEEENQGLVFLIYEDAFFETIVKKFEDKKCPYRCHLGRISTCLTSLFNKPGYQMDVFQKLKEGRSELSDLWEEFSWNELEDYNFKQKKFLAGVNPYRKSSKTHSRDKLPGADMSNNWGDNQSAFPTDFQTDYDVFSSSDRFDDDGEDGKGKDMFEMFCCERNGVTEDEFCLSDEEKFESADDFSFANPDSEFTFTTTLEPESEISTPGNG